MKNVISHILTIHHCTHSIHTMKMNSHLFARNDYETFFLYYINYSWLQLCPMEPFMRVAPTFTIFWVYIYQNNRRVSGKFKLITCTVEQKLFLTKKSMHTYYLVEFLTRSMYSTLFELCEWSFFAVRDKHALVHANTQNYIFIIVL